jgi:RNA polymerase sigma-70 factor (ECF subfamily)
VRRVKKALVQTALVTIVLAKIATAKRTLNIFILETTILWTEFSETLHRFILKKVKHKAVADDLLQEVFIKIHMHKSAVQQKNRLESWVYTIARHTINDYFRKKQKERSLPPNEKTSENEESLKHHPQDCLKPLINNLSEVYREAIYLSEINGYKHKEVADKLNISLSAAKSRILRGKKLLQKGFMDCCDYRLDAQGYLRGEHKNIEDCKVCN